MDGGMLALQPGGRMQPGPVTRMFPPPSNNIAVMNQPPPSNFPPPQNIASQQPQQQQQQPGKQQQYVSQVRQQLIANQGMLFDGKRMRKSVNRKVVDYNSSVFNYIKNRVWQRDYRDVRAVQPDGLYQTNLMPPISTLNNPMNCVTTKFVRQSTNKFRCPIFVLTWTPEGRRLVTGASSGEFTLWNGLSFNFETILQAHDVSVRAMQWSHNDQWMVTADHAGFIKYWQTNMNNVNMYQGHKEAVRGIRWAPDTTPPSVNPTIMIFLQQILSIFPDILYTIAPTIYVIYSVLLNYFTVFVIK
ncbi:pre-mRNA 3' end processing protein WDR33 isoform X2 [Patella vulgata]|uniref:pre-mRNA 3' end processing protein WDR33 isoform X2 n=1 Tax=Patella vulgata TaxID=6465 RepID=UPI00217F49CA|nr:pre-mRNA 3' end processing protein WDR33 isoform X2 [Patella vulgata]